jgi:chromate transporter
LQSEPDRRAANFAEAFKFWLKLGFISFQPDRANRDMQTELVERKGGSANHARFLRAQLHVTAGPRRSGDYVGWLLLNRGGLSLARSLSFRPSLFCGF